MNEEIIKTCKECPNYEGIGENRKGKVYIKCAVFDSARQIQKKVLSFQQKEMDECDFRNWRICSRCGMPIYDIYYHGEKPYCKNCYKDLNPWQD